MSRFLSHRIPLKGVMGLAFAATLISIAATRPDETANLGQSCHGDETDGDGPVYQSWIDLLDIPASLDSEEVYQRAGPVVNRTFDLDVMASRIYGDRWGRLDEPSRGKFIDALGRRVAKELRASWADATDPPKLVETVQAGGGVVEVRYSLTSGQTEETISLQLEADTGGECRIVNISVNDRWVLGGINDWVKDLREDYSFQYMVAELGDYGFVTLEDFESTPEGELPLHWEWKGKDNDRNKPYRVKVEAGNQYLEATDEGESVIMGRNLKWDLDKYPFISFRVRIWEIPEGADESDDSAVDSAAGLYFTYKKKLFGKIPESAKYVWSSTLPVGTAVRREGIGRPWQIVFGSGHEGIGEWRTYVFDLRQAYRDTFDGDPPSKPLGMGVLSDANSMKAKAYADYDDIRALRSAPESVTSGVFKILQPKSKTEG